ncbi:MAG: DUF1385 domain-containing protein [Halanaerobiales bacterium]|nr:DUF1385 domain-containing protein [Halanaerobiales bacterium]
MSREVSYGGQAVIEGVMMKGLNRLAVAVRKPDNSIVVQRRKLTPLSEKFKFFGWPFIRGVVTLFSSLILGMQSLTYAANQVTEEDEELSPFEMSLTIIVSLGLALLLFVALPAGIIALIQQYIHYDLLLNVIEGLIKITAFLTYIVLIGKLDDIKRVFMYHGAEHKVIHNYESDKELSVENAREFTTLHARCGTNFLFIVIILSILFFSFFGRPSFLYRILYHILLLPIIAGTSYEVIKLAGGDNVNPLIKVLATPGLWLQKLTTNEPDDDMLEIAITALKGVLPEEERGEEYV